MLPLDMVLGGLMRRYEDRVPDVGVILGSLRDHGILEIENDHIAFRTLGVPQLGIRSFEKMFKYYGYQKRDAYHFETKKLDAFWYSPPSPGYPRIFVSELRVWDLSEDAQRIIHSYSDEVRADPVDSLDLESGEAVDQFLHSSLWRIPTWSDYSRLLEESEYAAWVIYNRYYLNHFTISTNSLPSPFDSVAGINVLVEEIGVKLNDSGGKIKISPDGLLLQSSTVAELVDAQFSDGDWHKIAGSYVEFAERKVLPEFAAMRSEDLKRCHRREGFEAGNADKIFESTFANQVANS